MLPAPVALLPVVAVGRIVDLLLPVDAHDRALHAADGDAIAARLGASGARRSPTRSSPGVAATAASHSSRLRGLPSGASQRKSGGDPARAAWRRRACGCRRRPPGCRARPRAAPTRRRSTPHDSRARTRPADRASHELSDGTCRATNPSMHKALSEVDPEIASLVDDGRAAPAREDPAHPVGELHLGGGARGLRHGAAEQVLRGLSGQALLRGAAVHRPDRGARHRARQVAVRRRPRQRAAVLGLAGEPGRLPRVLPAGRHHHGHGRCPPAAT